MAEAAARQTRRAEARIVARRFWIALLFVILPLLGGRRPTEASAALGRVPKLSRIESATSN